MNGPVEKDTWIAYPNKPDENGTLLTADGYGGNFINKVDTFTGPYTSNYELAPVLVQLGIPGIWLGQRYMKADPAVSGRRVGFTPTFGAKHPRARMLRLFRPHATQSATGASAPPPLQRARWL